MIPIRGIQYHSVLYIPDISIAFNYFGSPNGFQTRPLTIDNFLRTWKLFVMQSDGTVIEVTTVQNLLFIAFNHNTTGHYLQ